MGWYFLPGVNNVTDGIIEVSTMGTHLLRCMSGFGRILILVNDLIPKNQLNPVFNLEWVTKE
jgi:hypothetical protein